MPRTEREGRDLAVWFETLLIQRSQENLISAFGIFLLACSGEERECAYILCPYL